MHADRNALGHLLYRELSCFCQSVSKVCSCFDPKTFQFQFSENDVLPLASGTEASNSGVQSIAGTSGSVQTNTSSPGDAMVQNSLVPITTDNDVHLVGQYCVVKYNNKAYPRKILAVNESDITVGCMHCIGTKYDSNRFYWPDRVKDV